MPGLGHSRQIVMLDLMRTMIEAACWNLFARLSAVFYLVAASCFSIIQPLQMLNLNQFWNPVRPMGAWVINYDPSL